MKKTFNFTTKHRVAIDFKFEYINGRAIEIDFLPRLSCTNEEVLLLSRCKSFDERNNLYSKMEYDRTFFHEGARFGLKYAYDYYLNHSSEPKGIRVELEIKLYSGTFEEIVAYACASTLLDFLGFDTKKIVWYSTELKKYRFPYTQKLIPLGEYGLENLKKAFKEGGATKKQLDDATRRYIAAQKEYADISKKHDNGF